MIRLLTRSILVLFFPFQLIAQQAILVADLNPGSNDGAPQEYETFNIGGVEHLMFTAVSQNEGRELWKYDGVNPPSMVMDIRPGTSGSTPTDLEVFNGKLYFNANDGSSGIEMWEYDGVNPPQLRFDFRAGSLSGNPRDFTEFNGNLYFRANDGINGWELWEFDGVNNPTIVADINPGINPSIPDELTVFNNKLCFKANDGVNGTELWEYDGVSVTMVSDIHQGMNGSNPSYFGIYNGQLFFNADDGLTGTEPWVYDGTNPPNQVIDLVPGSSGSAPARFTSYNGKMVFAAYNSSFGSEVYEYDGTNPPTMLMDIYTGPTNSLPNYFNILDGVLYFKAENAVNGAELWRYDGTTVSLAADVIPGAQSGSPAFITLFKDGLYFTAIDTIAGFELFKFDCTKTFSSITVSSCKSFTAPSGKIFDSTGVYTDTLFQSNSYGCDSIITVDLTINGNNTAVDQNGTTLTSAQSGVNYQWINCDNQSPITGETGQSFVPAVNGSYAVILDNGTCVDTTNCFAISSLSSDPIQSEKEPFVAYPNPARNTLTIETSQPFASGEVFAIDGRKVLVFNEKTIDISELPKGIYVVVIEFEGSVSQKKIVVE